MGLVIPERFQPHFEPGCYVDVPNATYHACPALGSTGIKAVAKTVSHYLNYLEEGVDDAKHLDVGDALHAAVLEPDRYQVEFLDRRVPSRPDGSKWRSQYVEAASMRADGAEWSEVATALDNKEKTVKRYLKKDGFHDLIEHFTKHPFDPVVAAFSDKDFDDIEAWRESILGNPIARFLLREADEIRIEHSFWWLDPVTGMPCRCRPDALVLTPRGWVAVDIKTTRDASFWGFRRAVARYKYHCQAALYSDGIEHWLGEELADFVFVAVEKEAPYLTALYSLDEEGMERGRSFYREALWGLRAYYEDPDCWVGYGEPERLVQTLDVPGWAG